MEYITITAIDRHSSDTMSRTIPTNNIRSGIEQFEQDLPFTRYELTTIDDVDELTFGQINTLEDLEVTF